MEKNIVLNDSVTLEDMKSEIVDHILYNYGMSVKDFAQSKVAKDLKLNTRNLQSYLSNGSTSLPTLNILCEHFGIGTIVRKVVVTRTETYLLQKTKRNGKKGK